MAVFGCTCREKPFECETCGKSFAIRRQFVAHRYSHAKQTQRCPVCKKRFYNPLRLAAHISSQHDNIDDLPDPPEFPSTVTAHMNEDGQLVITQDGGGGGDGDAALMLPPSLLHVIHDDDDDDDDDDGVCHTQDAQQQEDRQSWAFEVVIEPPDCT